jgi:hypothetical protein
MKKGEQPEFSAKWWKSSQPKGLKAADKLDDALKSYEAAKKKLEASGEPDAVKSAKDALGTVETAVDSVIAEASKDKKSPEMALTVDVLKKYSRLYGTEEAWIEDQAEEDDDSVFGDPDAYHTYLIAAMKKLRSGQMNFGFVLGKKAEDHRLAVHRSKGAKALATTLVKETGLHAMTFGTAKPDENRAGVLLLVLEARQLAGIKKKGERMLKKFKPLPFTKLAVMVEGKEVEDIDDPEDTDVDEPDEPAAQTAGAAPGDDAQGGSQTQPNGPDPAKLAAFAEARATWLATRKKVETDINKLQDEFLASFKGHARASDLERGFRSRTETVLTAMDEELAHTLEAARSVADPDQHAKLVQNAKQIIQRYEDYIAKDPTIAALDANPFVPLAIQKTFTTTLSVLSKTIV